MIAREESGEAADRVVRLLAERGIDPGIDPGIVARELYDRAPFGYLKPAKGEAIIPNPDTAPFVVRAFEMRTADDS